MKCPFCRQGQTDVRITRPTYHQSQTWRRRYCQACQKLFTTYERLDLGFLKVVKKTGVKQRYSRAKLYSGIYGAFLSVKNKELIVDKITDLVEEQLLDQKQSELTSQQIAQVVLETLREQNMAAFARFLAYQTDLATSFQLIKELRKYDIL